MPLRWNLVRHCHVSQVALRKRVVFHCVVLDHALLPLNHCHAACLTCCLCLAVSIPPALSRSIDSLT